MPGIKGPSDYSQEPTRHPCLQINAKEPFNAEPPRSALVSSYVTPVDLFYKRNHGPIPVVDDIERYCVSICGLVENKKQLYMNDIRKLPKYNITATLQCAGNRRTAMSKTRTVKGVGWDVSAIGNAVWGGAKLADVLELVGISKLTSTSQSGGKHVEFVSIDKCKEENGGPYKASIPLNQATNPESDVLLAYEMNGEPLNRDHGYPLRVVVPGVIGARSVKWLESINIIAEECQGFFMQKDYKMFPPTVNWENINWSTRRPQMDFPVQCVICSLEDVNVVKHGKVLTSMRESTGSYLAEHVAHTIRYLGIRPTTSACDAPTWQYVQSNQFAHTMMLANQHETTPAQLGLPYKPFQGVTFKITVSGYAASGGGRGIERVDISPDGGKTWVEASRYQKAGVPYISEHKSSDKWAWVLFEVTFDIPNTTEIVAKAVDSAANVQPEKVEDIWNLRGILNTSWHRVQVRVGYSNM